MEFSRKDVEALFVALRIAIGTQAGKVEQERIDEWKRIIKNVQHYLISLG